MTKFADTDLVRRTFELAELAAGDDEDWGPLGEREVDIIASTDAVDSYDEVVAQDWDLKRFNKNPVILYGHNSYSKPIGTSIKTKVLGGKLKARVRFATAAANPEAEQVRLLVSEKVVRAVSVGFRCKKAKYDPATETYVLSGCSLFEISFVAIGANPDAVTLSALSAERSFIRALAGRDAAAPQETKNMEQLLKKLGATTEAEALNAIDSLQRVRSSVLNTTGARTEAELEGTLQAWKQASSQLADVNAKLADQAAKNEARERDELIKSARAEGKIAPASVEWAKSASLESLKSFLATAPAIPAFKSADKVEPEVESALLKWQGKTWDELKPAQKHALHSEQPELYAAMRKAAA